jgi:hypothetical protein
MTENAFRNVMIVSRLLEAYWGLHGVYLAKHAMQERNNT